MTEHVDAEAPQSIKDILELVRKEARHLEQEQQVSMSVQQAPVAIRELPEYEYEPETLPAKTTYHVNEFLVFDDIEFVANAIRGIMQREPDESGLDSYTAQLREHGERAKMDIILDLMSSPEGRKNNVRILGLRWARWELKYKDAWWMRYRWTRMAFDIAKYRFRNDQFEYTLLNEMRRRADREQMGRYLQAQSDIFRYLQQREQHLEAEYERLSGTIEVQQRELSQARRDVAIHQQRVNLLLDKLADLGEDAGERRQALAPHMADKLDAFYLAFENECRGDENEIREQLGFYLSQLPEARLISPAAPVLDIGSGRGEWLALLAEQGVSAKGVDISQVLVDHCRGKALDVTLADAVEYLERQADGSFAAVTAFHVIEHLPFELLFSLVEQAHRTLLPGGRLIFETPNPENLMVGSHTFYHDPTHRNPITPTLADCLLRHLGFSEVRLERLHPYPPSARVRGDDPLTDRINGAFCGPQDFAVIATRAP